MSASRYANGHRRRSLVARVRAMGEPCHICGLPIPPDAPAGHPLAFELDELVPVSKGGSPVDFENTAGSHRVCNQWRSNKSVEFVAQIRSEVLKRFGGWSSPLQFTEMARSISKVPKSSIVPIRHPKRSSGTI